MSVYWNLELLILESSLALTLKFKLFIDNKGAMSSYSSYSLLLY